MTLTPHNRPDTSSLKYTFCWHCVGKHRNNITTQVTPHYFLLTMPPILQVQCPICKSSFTDRKALESHTGTQEPTSAVAHQCQLCKRQFCSEKAVHQHQSAPSHNTLSVDQGLDDHKKARHSAIRSPIIFVPAGWSKGRIASGVGVKRGCKAENITEHMQIDEDWALCDKDCGWCGQCAASHGYWMRHIILAKACLLRIVVHWSLHF